jgi:hypothetical protein
MASIFRIGAIRAFTPLLERLGRLRRHRSAVLHHRTYEARQVGNGRNRLHHLQGHEERRAVGNARDYLSQHEAVLEVESNGAC